LKNAEILSLSQQLKVEKAPVKEKISASQTLIAVADLPTAGTYVPLGLT